MLKSTTSALKKFEGVDVIEATIKVVNAGDGLSEALNQRARDAAVGQGRLDDDDPDAKD